MEKLKLFLTIITLCSNFNLLKGPPKEDSGSETKDPIIYDTSAFSSSVLTTRDTTTEEPKSHDILLKQKIEKIMAQHPVLPESFHKLLVNNFLEQFKLSPEFLQYVLSFVKVLYNNFAYVFSTNIVDMETVAKLAIQPSKRQYTSLEAINITNFNNKIFWFLADVADLSKMVRYSSFSHPLVSIKLRSVKCSPDNPCYSLLQTILAHQNQAKGVDLHKLYDGVYYIASICDLNLCAKVMYDEAITRLAKFGGTVVIPYQCSI